MFDGEQLVETKWSSGNTVWLENKGYKYTGYFQPVLVKAKDLSPISKLHVKVVCDYCGGEYETTYAHIYKMNKNNEKHCCIHCRQHKKYEKNVEERYKRVMEETLKILEQNNLRFVKSLTPYKTVKDRIIVECPIHGEFETSYDNVLQHQSQCRECYYDALRNNHSQNRLSTEEVISRVESVKGCSILNPEDYVSNTTVNLKIVCRECGEIYTTSLAYFETKKAGLCPHCSLKESEGERTVRKFLEDHGIAFEQEKRFPECRLKKELMFDFYLSDFNTIVEFDGDMHYKPKFGMKSYLDTVRRDIIKNLFCEENHIKLIRIPYWDRQNISEILTRELNLQTV